jgi:hypothetical protein
MNVWTGIAALLIGLLLIWKGRPDRSGVPPVFCNLEQRLFSIRRSFWFSLPLARSRPFRAVREVGSPRPCSRRDGWTLFMLKFIGIILIATAVVVLRIMRPKNGRLGIVAGVFILGMRQAARCGPYFGLLTK